MRLLAFLALTMYLDYELAISEFLVFLQFTFFVHQNSDQSLDLLLYLLLLQGYWVCHAQTLRLLMNLVDALKFCRWSISKSLRF